MKSILKSSVQIIFIISLVINIYFIGSHFYQNRRDVTVYIGNEYELIGKIIEILEFNDVLYTIRNTNLQATDSTEKSKAITINVYLSDIDRAILLINEALI